MQKFMLVAFVFFWILSHVEASCPKYNRKDYRHWIDSDRDCQNTRNEVLIQESLEPVSYKSSKAAKFPPADGTAPSQAGHSPTPGSWTSITWCL